MASITKSSLCLTITLLIFISTISSTHAQTADCASKLLDCVNDLNTNTTPSASCCTSIRQTVATDLPCLCNLYNSPGLLANFNVSVDKALNLTSRCGIPVSLSACNVTGPTSAPPPPVPGNDGFRMSWTGFSSVLLLLAYALLY